MDTSTGAPQAADTHDNAYAGLNDADPLADGGHWAFGTGFDDPLAGVDPTVPDGIDRGRHAAHLVALADDGLLLAQRLSEWIAHGPEIEEEVALANIALDLLGQVRMLYARAAQVDPACVPDLPGSPAPAEDRLAYFREGTAFRNVRLVELERGDFAFTMLRLLAFATWRLTLLEQLSHSADPVLAAVAAKGVKECRYHVEHAARWVVTLAHGTEESRRRLEAAYAAVTPWLPELWRAEPDVADVARTRLDGVLAPLALAGALAGAPAGEPGDGRAGEHTSHLDEALTTLQSVARAHPKGRW